MNGGQLHQGARGGSISSACKRCPALIITHSVPYDDASLHLLHGPAGLAAYCPSAASARPVGVAPSPTAGS